MQKGTLLTKKHAIKFFVIVILVICCFYSLFMKRDRYADIRESKFNNNNTTFTDMHRCTENKIPLISSPLDTAQHLLFTNKSFIRFGDGDTYLVMNRSVFYQSANTTLSQRMMEILQGDDPRLMIGLVDTFSDCYSINRGAAGYWRTRPELREFMEANIGLSRQYFSTIISSVYTHSTHTFCNHLNLIYSTLKEIWREKDIVLVRGNNSQIYTADIYETAKSQTIYYASRYNAWSDYQELKTALLKEPPDKLFILSAGPVGKVLSYDLMRLGRRALDLGHLAKDYNAYMTKSPNRHFFRD